MLLVSREESEPTDESINAIMTTKQEIPIDRIAEN